MLVLSRKLDEALCLGLDYVVNVVSIRGDKVRLGVTARNDALAVDRGEVRLSKLDECEFVGSAVYHGSLFPFLQGCKAVVSKSFKDSDTYQCVFYARSVMSPMQMTERQWKNITMSSLVLPVGQFGHVKSGMVEYPQLGLNPYELNMEPRNRA